MRSSTAQVIFDSARRRLLVGWGTLVVLCASSALESQAQAPIMEPADAARIEAGAPAFAVRSLESIGLAGPPTDLHLLPDGRLLVVATPQLAIGDGSRWEVFRQARSEPTVPARRVAVARDGGIYVGSNAGFARIEFNRDASWSARLVEPWPGGQRAVGSIPRVVIDTGSEWAWHSGSGPVTAWRPGTPPRILGRVDSIQHVFSFGDAHYLSDRLTGDLWQIGDTAMRPVVFPHPVSPSRTITCAVACDDQLLVGTYGRGVQVFDGRTLQPYTASGVLAGNFRVNDLCAIDGDFFAAAIEDHGIFFFDRSGRIVQALTRELDHRFTQVSRLLAAPGGVLWGLTDEGLLQLEFPSRVSHFERLIGSGVDIAQPFRFGGELWVIADGAIRRGVYDDDERLVELRIDTPPGRFATTASTHTGLLLVGTDRGAFVRAGDGWREFAPSLNGLHLLDRPPMNDRWLFVAIGAVGWLWRNGDELAWRSWPVPQLGQTYLSTTDRDGSVWVELGNARLGRIRILGEEPAVEIFGPEDGIPDSWAQVFAIDGRVRFNIGDRILRFDETTRRFVPDEDFAGEFEGFSQIVGRPGRDSAGRLWITANGAVQVLEPATGGGWRNRHEKMPANFLPYYFTFEQGGVVWMHSEGRLTRYDPAMPAPPFRPLRAVITRVVAGARQQNLFTVAQPLRALPYADRSLTVHFCAPGSAFTPVDFDVMLEGADSEWVPSGSSGAASFNRLREGNYRLRVRPRSNGTAGVEAGLAFSILPPWYRTRTAYTGYVLLLLAAVVSSGRLFSFFQRRENARLETLVAQRTRELNASNERLAAQLDENRMLSKAIEQSPASVIITDRAGRIVFANPRAYELSGRAGHGLIGLSLRTLRADSATPELLAQMEETVQRGETWRGQLASRQPDGCIVQLHSLVAPLRDAAGNVHHYLVLEQDVTAALAEQERRRRLEAQLVQAQKLESVGTLAGGIAHDFNNILTAILGYCELASLDGSGNAAVQRDLAGIRSAGLRAKDLVARILTFSRQTLVQLVPLDLTQPVAEAVKFLRASTPSTIELVSTLQSGTVRADPTQIQQIVLNLCTNAIHAIPNQHGRIEITVQRVCVSAEIAAEVPQLWAGDAMRLAVTDDGCGMDEATVRRIFDPFFTTKPQGEGTGLGLAIVQGVVASHEGAIRVRSTPGVGSSFEVYFRPCEDTSLLAAPSSPVPHGRQEEIIVVDDERTVANFAATRLQQLGYVPMAFCDPQAALNAFAAEPARFHAIVTDLTMPQLTGADLIRQIRARGWLIPAVIITGYQGEAVRASVNKLPRCIVLPKPFSGDELARALHQVMSDYTPLRHTSNQP